MSEWASGTNMKSLNYVISGTSSGGIIKDANNEVVEKTFTLRVRHAANMPLKAGTVTVYDNEGTVYKSTTVSDSQQGSVAIDSGSASGSANIPEFPTVAAPIAGIIGLLFVFGRRKEGL
ncbi:PEF-CTERM sorting domain-containing protein [Methanosarcina sp. MSH10X1]|nr:PEF-CTERM sorting domain-containing protein [Methanosarcina sp. MSH10X1]